MMQVNQRYKKHNELALLLNEGESLYKKGQIQNSLASYQKALEMIQKKQVTDYKKKLYTMKWVAKCMRELGDFKNALKIHKKMLLILNTNIQDNLQLSFVHNDLGICYQNQSKYQKAIDHHLKSFDIKNELIVSEQYPIGKIPLSASFNNLGNCYKFSGEYRSALRFYEKALLHERRVNGFNHAATILPLKNVGNCQMALGNIREAIEALQLAVNLRNSQSSKSLNTNIPRELNNFGNCLRRQGKFDDAINQHEKALDYCEKLYKKPHVDKAYSRIGLGKCYFLKGEYERALQLFSSALEEKESSFQFRNIDYFHLYIDFGHVLSALGRSQDSFSYFQKAEEVLEKLVNDDHSLYTENHPNFGDILSSKSSTLVKQGKYHEAILSEEKAISIKSRAFELWHPEIARSECALGELHYTLGDFSKALNRYEAAYLIYLKVFGDNHYELVECLLGIGNSLVFLDRLQEAKKRLDEALKVTLKSLGENHPVCAKVKVSLASCLSLLEQHKESNQLFKEALDLRKKLLPENHPDTVYSEHYLKASHSILNNEPIDLVDDVRKLEKEDFQKLITYALCYLEKEHPENLKFALNPTGFVRLHLPVPMEYRERLDGLRLNYWPLDFKIKVVEAQHSHPKYFESLIIKGGYTHSLFEKTSENPNFRGHRIFKNTTEERCVFFTGVYSLKKIQDESMEKGTIIRFPRKLIHQVTTTQPGTLSINCVFKNKNHSFFDIFVPKESPIDPQVEREDLIKEKTSSIVSQIIGSLKAFNY